MGGGDLGMTRFFGDFASLLILGSFESEDDDVGSVDDEFDEFGGFELLVEVLYFVEVNLALEYGLLDLEHEHVIGGLDERGFVIYLAL